MTSQRNLPPAPKFKPNNTSMASKVKHNKSDFAALASILGVKQIDLEGVSASNVSARLAPMVVQLIHFLLNGGTVLSLFCIFIAADVCLNRLMTTRTFFKQGRGLDCLRSQIKHFAVWAVTKARRDNLTVPLAFDSQMAAFEKSFGDLWKLLFLVHLMNQFRNHSMLECLRLACGNRGDEDTYKLVAEALDCCETSNTGDFLKNGLTAISKTGALDKVVTDFSDDCRHSFGKFGQYKYCPDDMQLILQSLELANIELAMVNRDKRSMARQIKFWESGAAVQEKIQQKIEVNSNAEKQAIKSGDHAGRLYRKRKESFLSGNKIPKHNYKGTNPQVTKVTFY